MASSDKCLVARFAKVVLALQELRDAIKSVAPPGQTFFQPCAAPTATCPQPVSHASPISVPLLSMLVALYARFFLRSFCCTFLGSRDVSFDSSFLGLFFMCSFHL